MQFGRGKKADSGAAGHGTAACLAQPNLDAVAALLPCRDGWERFVNRVVLCCGDLATPEGASTLASRAVAAGCEAVPVLENSRLWERLTPADRREREGFEDRVRLGLFFAASLKYLLPLLCTVRVRAGKAQWEPFLASLPDFLKEHGAATPEVTWLESPPHAGRMLALASFFLGRQEVVDYLTPAVAQEVFDYLRPDGNQGLFGTILGDAGQAVDQAEPVDVAAVFLAALAQAAERKVLRLNTRMGGHVFVAPAFWLLTTPKGLDCVTGLIRTRLLGRRHDLTRHEVFRALRSGGHLAGAGGKGAAAWVCEVDAEGWERPLELHGLPRAVRRAAAAAARGTVFQRHHYPEEGEREWKLHSLTPRGSAGRCTATGAATKAADSSTSRGASVTSRAAC